MNWLTSIVTMGAFFALAPIVTAQKKESKLDADPVKKEIKAKLAEAKTDRSKKDPAGLATRFTRVYSLLLDRKYVEALRSAQEILPRCATSSCKARALFHMALCHQSLNNFGQALALYKQVYTQHPKDRMAERALFQAARVHERYYHSYAKALELYGRVANYDSYLSLPARVNRAQIMQWNMKDYQNAQKEWRGVYDANQKLLRHPSYYSRLATQSIEFLKKHEDNDWLPLTSYFDASNHAREGKYAEALAVIARLEKDFPQAKIIPKASLLKAQCLHLKGNVEQALSCYQQIATKSADPQVRSLARNACRRLASNPVFKKLVEQRKELDRLRKSVK